MTGLSPERRGRADGTDAARRYSSIPVTRFDLTEFVGDLFHRGPATPPELARRAANRGARPAIVTTLRRLPAGAYETLTDVWRQLPDLPVEHDPWSAGRP